MPTKLDYKEFYRRGDIMIDDTIVGIATPAGSGGIGIIRVSGDEAIDLVNRVLVTKKSKPLKDLPSHGIYYGHIVDTDGESVIDEVLVSLMKAPNTYTREHVVEINCHGGILVVQKILALMLRIGARLAEPGEFTKRAFLNGRIDLSQAEAVMDVINAKTDLALKTSVNQLEGSLTKKIRALRQELIEMIASIEAAIDYPEYEVEEQPTVTLIQKESSRLLEKLKKLSSTANTGKILKEGIMTVIVGKPNVGKSSFMNALLREQRAIVTDIPGTTRDVLEEFVNLEGVPLRIYDTAGIRQTEDVVEKIGVERSKEYVDRAELAILVLDLSEELEEEDNLIMDRIKDQQTIVVLNKTDLPRRLDLNRVKHHLPNARYAQISAKEETGLEDFTASLKDIFLLGNIDVNENTYITNVRHKDALIKAEESLYNVLESIEMGMPEDCFAIDLKNCYEYLGEITGDSVSDSIIDQIFSQFCLGK